MKFEKIHNKGQAQLFRNDYLEMLTKTHPLVIWGMYFPVFVGLPYYSYAKLSLPFWQVVTFFIVGMFCWTLVEYILHRFLFHMIGESERAQRIIYVMHGNHHHFPRDKERLFMPPVPSLIIAAILFSVFYSIMGKYVFMFFPGWFQAQ